ncbi:MAG: hypothetical protein IPK79_04825 [Vampirovibrionales bacterium]|nr:hypothetical protein [Vampirovibrionales bacterium]
MSSTPLMDISLSTLIEVSPLLGGRLENREAVRKRQNLELIHSIIDKTSIKLESKYAKRFHFGSMDFLIQKKNGAISFSPIEMNGTGMAGISNNPTFVIETLLSEMKNITKNLNSNEPALFLAPFSGTQELKTSGTTQLLHERILFAQALKEGFKEKYGEAQIIPLQNLTKEGKFTNEKPTIVLGFLKDFIPYLRFEEGSLKLLNRTVNGSIHDQFCDILYHKFIKNWDKKLPNFINHIFPITTDKAAALDIFNQLLSSQSFPHLGVSSFTESCKDRNDLIKSVLKARQENRSVVIKPHASGLGRGIDFFISPESEQSIIQKIDLSIESCQRYYGVGEHVFPYAVCEFIDSPVIDFPGSIFHGHKYELRFFAFRDGDRIHAIPSIVKISSMRYDSEKIDRLMLMNNVAITKKITNKTGLDYILPLSNYETLDLLALSSEHLYEICGFLTRYIDYALRKIEPLPPWRLTSSTFKAAI